MLRRTQLAIVATIAIGMAALACEQTGLTNPQQAAPPDVSAPSGTPDLSAAVTSGFRPVWTLFGIWNSSIKLPPRQWVHR